MIELLKFRDTLSGNNERDEVSMGGHEVDR